MENAYSLDSDELLRSIVGGERQRRSFEELKRDSRRIQSHCNGLVQMQDARKPRYGRDRKAKMLVLLAELILDEFGR